MYVSWTSYSELTNVSAQSAHFVSVLWTAFRPLLAALAVHRPDGAAFAGLGVRADGGRGGRTATAVRARPAV
eukprot:9732907-Alexandrium_andersonii.AAC.1